MICDGSASCGNTLRSNSATTDDVRFSNIAVLDHDGDNLDVLRVVLEQEGFGVVTALVQDVLDGALDMERWIAEHDAAVIV